ncbi:hypothetical protein DMN91_004157 [Ooceraea biroi]|uniref:Retrotransposon gag domain-containing protein n=1 Tax=Ooceraea biroi TaxID=2015173 RepID=A0A3L8DVI8_OOCBI|nr:hypothetical protein DMN91_004157 [Ooceraea biroi]
MAQANISPELLQAMSAMMANALQASVANFGTGANETSAMVQRRTPPFSLPEFRSAEGTSVADYFKRFQWALELSKISETQFANYARVHMGSELNNALKFLVSPRLPEDISYEDIRTTLITHFDRARNKYTESIRFRCITQEKDEAISSFTLRLRQGAAYCELNGTRSCIIVHHHEVRGIQIAEQHRVNGDPVSRKPEVCAVAAEDNTSEVSAGFVM